MNRDDILRMAREVADVETDSRGRETFSFDCYGVERLAAIYAAAEREACANEVRAFFAVMRFDRRHLGLGDVRVTVGDVDDLADSICKNQLEIESVKDSLTVEEAVAAEREACAQIVEREAMTYADPVWAVEIVNDIRARDPNYVAPKPEPFDPVAYRELMDKVTKTALKILDAELAKQGKQ